MRFTVHAPVQVWQEVLRRAIELEHDPRIQVFPIRPAAGREAWLGLPAARRGNCSVSRMQASWGGPCATLLRVCGSGSPSGWYGRDHCAPTQDSPDRAGSLDHTGCTDAFPLSAPTPAGLASHHRCQHKRGAAMPPSTRRLGLPLARPPVWLLEANRLRAGGIRPDP